MTEEENGREWKEARAPKAQPWEVDQVRDILRAQGRMIDFRPEDLDADHVREMTEVVGHSRRLREEAFVITRVGPTGTAPSLIWREVMGW